MNLTTYLTISKCPAQMALCKAVIPSSFAALGFGTLMKTNEKRKCLIFNFEFRILNKMSFDSILNVPAWLSFVQAPIHLLN